MTVSFRPIGILVLMTCFFSLPFFIGTAAVRVEYYW
jgi:hypothetical protein